MPTLLSTPAPQWSDRGALFGLAASRLVPVLDLTGFWVLKDFGPPSGAFVNDSGGSGFTVIDDTLTSGLSPTLTPSGTVVIY